MPALLGFGVEQRRPRPVAAFCWVARLGGRAWAPLRLVGLAQAIRLTGRKALGGGGVSAASRVFSHGGQISSRWSL